MMLTTTGQTRFAEEVCAGLTKPGQKELPSKYLYDAVGSRLFDVITELPEYGLTRAEDRILERHAREIATRVPHSVAIAELGSGSGMKTRRILGALSRDHAVRYFPIEISATALAACEREMRDISALSVVGIEREYLDGLLEVAARRKEGEHLLVLFLGSTIGNFEPEAALTFLRKIRSMLEPGDFLLLGTDLLKPVPVLLDAYDDPLGVTAAFNMNLLARINRDIFCCRSSSTRLGSMKARGASRCICGRSRRRRCRSMRRRSPSRSARATRFGRRAVTSTGCRRFP
jgi:L-histidine N-alpha-methyltransferase